MGSKDLPWVMLSLKVGNVSALTDTGAQFSCVRLDVAEFLSRTGEPCKFLPCSVLCSLADGSRCEVTDAVKFGVKLLKFTWNHEFKLLLGGPFPVILGMDFLCRSKMVVDLSANKYSFGFAPDCSGDLCRREEDSSGEMFLQGLADEVSQVATGGQVWPGGVISQSILAEFPELFSLELGKARRMR